jgi:hypothetical protein
VATDRYGILVPTEDGVSKSVKSVYIVVRLDFQGHDVSNDVVTEAIENMDYSFHYDNYHLSLMDTEIVDMLYSYKRGG